MLIALVVTFKPIEPVNAKPMSAYAYGGSEPNILFAYTSDKARLL